MAFPDDAFGIVAVAAAFDAEFAALLTFLLYISSRIGAALSLRREDLDLPNKAAWWARPQKGQQNHTIVLHDDPCAKLT